MSVWFTADTHFGHTNIIRYCERPFSSVEEMDSALIENWNQIVNSGDTVYHLGDFTLAGQEKANYYFFRLNGRISVIPGGHDKRWLRKGDYVSKSGHPVIILPSLHTIKLSMPNLEQPQLIVLCHYSMRVWDRSHYGSWHLYGHSHGNLPPLKNSLDVGVDCCDYMPVSVNTICQAISEQKT
ncbi:MAG: phosphoesterase [Chloroflexota bacterium]|nr:phosphoesterase [Chloroflexota bacterium]